MHNCAQMQDVHSAQLYLDGWYKFTPGVLAMLDSMIAHPV